jgi:hypothetical protein
MVYLFSQSNDGIFLHFLFFQKFNKPVEKAIGAFFDRAGINLNRLSNGQECSVQLVRIGSLILFDFEFCFSYGQPMPEQVLIFFISLR